MQDSKYNFYFQKHLKETKWFGIFDLDEFLYSPLEINITNILKKYENQNQLHINWVHFGSSGHIEQPKKVVPNFLLRGEYNGKKMDQTADIIHINQLLKQMEKLN